MPIDHERLSELRSALPYTPDGDWALTVHADLSEPTFPSANIHLETRRSTRYLCHADSIEDAVNGAVNAAYREWVQMDPGSGLAPFTNPDDDHLRMLLEEHLANPPKP